MTKQSSIADIWAPRSGSRSISCDFESTTTCFYCETPIADFRSVKFKVPHSSISPHEGQCWDLFVVGVFAFNEQLVDLEAAVPN